MADSYVVGSATFEVTANTGPLKQQMLQAQDAVNRAVTGIKNLFSTIESGASLPQAIRLVGMYAYELDKLRIKAQEAHIAIYNLKSKFSGSSVFGLPTEIREVRKHIDYLSNLKEEIANFYGTLYTRLEAFTGLHAKEYEGPSYLPVGRGRYYASLERASAIRAEMEDEQSKIEAAWQKMAESVVLNVDRIAAAYKEYDAIIARENALQKAYAEQAKIIEQEKWLAIEAEAKAAIARRSYLNKEMQAQYALEAYGPKAGAQEAFVSAYQYEAQPHIQMVQKIAEAYKEYDSIIAQELALQKAYAEQAKFIEQEKWLAIEAEARIALERRAALAKEMQAQYALEAYGPRAGAQEAFVSAYQYESQPHIQMVQKIAEAYKEYDAIIASELALQKAYAEQAKFIEQEKWLAIEAEVKRAISKREYLSKELQAQYALEAYGPKAGAQEAFVSAYQYESQPHIQMVQKIAEAYKEYDSIIAQELALQKAYAEQAKIIEQEKWLAIEAETRKAIAHKRYLAKEMQAQYALEMYGPRAGSQEAFISAWAQTGVVNKASSVFSKLRDFIHGMDMGATSASSKMSSLDKTIGRINRSMGAFIAITALIKLNEALMTASESAINYNKNIENARVGIAALLSVHGQFVKQNNEIVTGVNALNSSLSLSDDIIKKLEVDNLKTTATFEQLLRAFQSALSPGLAAGFNVDQIRAYTLAMVQAASAMQLPLDMMAEELRSMLSGTITPRATIIATNLGITNEDIRRYSGNAQALFDFIMGKLQSFVQYGNLLQDTFSGVWSNLKDIMGKATGIAGKDFFDYLKNVIQDITYSIVDVNGALNNISIKPGVIEDLKIFYDTLSLLTKVTFSLGYVFEKAFITALMPLAHLNRLLDAALKKEDELEFKRKMLDKYSYKVGEKQPIEVEPGYGPFEALITDTSSTEVLSKNILKWQKTREEIIQALENKVFMSKKEFDDYVDTLYEVNNKLDSANKSIITAADVTRDLAMEIMYAGDEVTNFDYKAKGLVLTFDEILEKVKQIANVDLKSLSSTLTTDLERLRIRLDLLKQGYRGSALTAEEEYQTTLNSLIKAREAAYETPNATLGDLVYLNFLIQRKQKENEERRALEREISSITEGEKARGVGGRPLTVERMANEFRELERITEEHYQKMRELDSEYSISKLELEDRTYEASIARIDQRLDDEIYRYDQNIKDVEAKIKEMEDRVSFAKEKDPRVVQELNQQKQILNFLNSEREDYINKLRRQADIEKEITTYSLDNWMKMAEFYQNSATSLEEIAYWEKYILGLQREKELREKPPWMASSINKYYEDVERRSYIKSSGTFGEGFKLAFQDYYKDMPTMATLGADAFKTLTDSIESAADALSDFCMTGKMEFNDFALSLIKSMIQIITKFLLMEAIMGISRMLGLGTPTAAVGSGFASMGNLLPLPLSLTQTTFGSMYHSGTPSFVSKRVPAYLYNYAPRLHSGLNYDEYPAILQKGEIVVPKDAGSLKINPVQKGNLNNINTEINITVNSNGVGNINSSEHKALAVEISRMVSAEFDKRISHHLRPGGLIYKRSSV